MSIKLDKINLSILQSLQNDARQPIAAIADNAGISTSPCQKRIKQLENQGVITSYVANVNISKLCSTATFLAEITLQEHTSYAFQKFEEAIRKEAKMVECYQVSGAYDYLARFVCNDIEDYKAITDKLLALSPIKSIKSHCTLTKIKPYSGFPLNNLIEDVHEKT